MSQTCFPVNTLFYGDNLEILKNHLYDESIDLIYLDPPFNSKADYNVLFKERTGELSTAQIRAFSDFWHWDIQARHAYNYLATEAPSEVSDLITSMHGFLGENDMFAYLVMMGERLLELHRVLKSTGSIYLHCDTTASHYLKLLMDSIFGPENFRNEIVWRRSFAHGDAKQGAKQFGRCTDSLLFYVKTDSATWNPQYTPYSDEALKRDYKYNEEGTGRTYRLAPVDGPGGASKGNPYYEFLGVEGYYRFKQEKMQKLYEQGRIVKSSTGKSLSQKMYLDEAKGRPVDNLWDDINRISPTSSERLGYPTQKPIQLLERIIQASSNEGDWVLDPFCGCGTAIIAAEKLHRRWVGIDITYLAINLIKNRLRDSFPKSKFTVEGEPKDLDGVKELAERDRYQFQWWALNLIENAHPARSSTMKPKEGKKGADEGVDGWIRFADKAEGHYEKIVIQVKSGHVGVKDIRELRDTINRQKAAIGLFVTLEEPTSEMIKEVKATDPYVSPLWKHEYPSIQILTVEQLLKGAKPDIPSTTVNVFKEAEKIRKADRTKETKIHEF